MRTINIQLNSVGSAFVWIIFFSAMLIALPGWSQPPEVFQYQAVARDGNGNILSGQPVSFKIYILEGNPSGSSVYVEAHNVTTYNYGLVTLNIGEGQYISGNFSSINWAQSKHFLKIEMDAGGGTGFVYMGTSQLLSVPYALCSGTAANGVGTGSGAQTIRHDGNSWVGDSNISNDGTCVAVGPYSFGSKLTVGDDFPSSNTVEDIMKIVRGSTSAPGNGIGSGISFHNEYVPGSFLLSGRIASMMEDVTPGYTGAGLLFQTQPGAGLLNEALYIDPDGRIGIGTTNPIQNLHINGRVRIENTASEIALYTETNSVWAGHQIINTYEGGGQALMAGMTSPVASSSSKGIWGLNYGSGIAVYGSATKSTGTAIKGLHETSGNSGLIGNSSYGVYGEYGNGNYGYLGSSYYGAHGSHNNLNAGYLGTADFGVLGSLIVEEPGNFAVFGSGVNNASAAGTGFAYESTIGGVLGWNYQGNSYTYGVAGYSYIEDSRSGGCFGSKTDGTIWGALAYRTSGGTTYGGYFTSSNEQGESSNVNTRSGIGAWGDLFGADIHGKIYGLFAEGENYAIYSKGITFHDGPDVHLQDNGSGNRTVLYTHVSTDATVQTGGFATLKDGVCEVIFDPAFIHAVSPDEPVIVTVTPLGKSKGVYLDEISGNGFRVMENEDGKSNIAVSYMAMGKRAGYEKPVLPPEVVASGYTGKLARGLHNDNNTQTNGEGLYYENGSLNVGIHPASGFGVENPQEYQEEFQETELLPR